MPPKLCNFYSSPSGCRQGTRCHFRHVDKSTNNEGSQHGSQSSHSRQGSIVSLTPAGPPPPRGVCSSYWTRGQCPRGFACRFRHESPSAASGEQGLPLPGPSASSQAVDALAPFLTDKGLSRITGNGSDVYFTSPTSENLTPIEAHNTLKRFLYDDYRFNKTFFIYAFMKPLTSASSGNESWTSEDGQLLLSGCTASDNGLLRIRDILKWKPVSIKAGSNSQILSFQRGYLPLLRYLSSDFVVKSTLSHSVNALFMCVMDNLENFADTVEECMAAAMAAKSFRDPQHPASKDPLGSQVLASLANVLYECLTRFKNAVAVYPRLAPIVRHLGEWVSTWIAGISAIPSAFDDPFQDATPAARNHITSHLTSKVERLIAIVDREQAKSDRQQDRTSKATSSIPKQGRNEGIVAALHMAYEAPGELRKDGPRHDNDHLDIEHIRIAPTHQELISPFLPFLPANLWDAPHPFPAESMERLLDIQFRLLREELTAPLRTSIQLVREDLLAPTRTKTRLSELIAKGGGKYRGDIDGGESVMFNVYTRLEFVNLAPDWRGITAAITFDAPPGRARSPQAKARAQFWEGMSGKRLMQGGLVALVWKSGTDVAVHLGLLASSTREITDSVKTSEDRVALRVVFFDPEVELRILQSLKQKNQDNSTKILVEAPVMFEAIRPFLEALRAEPEAVPFGPCLVHRPPGFFDTFTVEPPAFSLVPGFTYDLSSLFPPEAGPRELRMSVEDPASIAHAREELRSASRLDPSQSDSVIDTLIRKISLIQGPPGTGKSYTGVELLRVLLANEIGPILMIAFTNHALDHMLCSVLDTNMTKKIVRLGGRSADERISQFSMENLEMVHGRSKLDYTVGQLHRELKSVDEQVRKLMVDFLKVSIETDRITRHMELQYPEQFEGILNPPQWISTVQSIDFDDGMGAWSTVGRGGQNDEQDRSTYAYWRTGRDLDFVDGLNNSPELVVQPAPERISDRSGQNKYAALANAESLGNDQLEMSDSDSDNEDLANEHWMENLFPAGDQISPPNNTAPPAPTFVQREAAVTEAATESPPNALRPSDLRDPADFFYAHGCDGVPVVPFTDRELDALMDIGDIWSLSRSERVRLDAFWTDRVRVELHENQLADFERLRTAHGEKLRTYNEGKDEARRQLLQNIDIIGCTTTGAAKLGSLLKGVEPRIMLVEEAGQVLEAHVLGSLVPSIEHMILIGDPQQLRPTLNNYSLSMESRRGSQLYKFDMSLMERLATSGFPMSRIDVQRRMRPTISNLIRHTLYPTLEDHDLVKQYPNVRGIAKNVFFLTHSHRENTGAEESASKFNGYEVAMIKDLVLYLLRQGCYSEEGDIVVLCAYLGQLAKVRDALANEVAVVIDGRDQVDLAEQEADKEDVLEVGSGVERVQVSKRVRLRTVDNYQGEEAKIVILSLVRNSGALDELDDAGFSKGGRVNIGFLKSENRTNVALSRAREGLFILGNHLNLAARSRMWQQIVEELEEDEAVGHAFPIVCHRHPETAEFVSEPGKLPLIAPDGGCLLGCDAPLKCGHLCPYKCHSDDPNHVSVACVRACRRLCPRGHPCNRQCDDPCGDCRFPIPSVQLPCGHWKDSVPCYQLESLADVSCDEVVIKSLPDCEHTAETRCSSDVANYLCQAFCGGIMDNCCGRDCKARCHECLRVNDRTTADGPIARKSHQQHPCQKTLYCEHRCENPCSQNHQCTTICKKECRQVCAHARCKKNCSTPCAPCQEECRWQCPHYTCPVPCGSVCARLPCDKRCEKLLKCGHPCSSVCGEDCHLQVCTVCASEDTKETIVDVLLNRTLGEIDATSDLLEDILITLPNCRHVFTVETLDGVCGMTDYYKREGLEGPWLGFEDPPTGFKKPPMCPTCRVAITSPRYGRIFKRADLDILENNVASQMTLALQDVSRSIESVSAEERKTMVETEAARVKVTSNVAVTKDQKAQKKARTDLLEGKPNIPAHADTVQPGSTLYSIDQAAAQSWQRINSQLIRAYGRTRQIAETRSAHVHAWESAFSYLYEDEMNRMMEDPAHAPRRPEVYAMRMARMKVGQPHPRADKRFLVEAFWITLDIRFTLAGLAQKWFEVAAGRAKIYPPEQMRQWVLYVQFMLRTSLKDAQVAFVIAKSSGSLRQAVKSTVYILRADLEAFRFRVAVIRQSKQLGECREGLVTDAESKSARAGEQVSQTAQKYIEVKDTPEDRQWLLENFSGIANTIMEEWDQISRSLKFSTFYQPVSLEEQMAVINALRTGSYDFQHTGHYYRCPNGHLYVIGDCGGASQVSKCPECNAIIGGSGHRLDPTNSRALDFEDMARQQGGGRNPWA